MVHMAKWLKRQIFAKWYVWSNGKMVQIEKLSNFSKMDKWLMATYANWPNESYCQMTLWHQNSQVAK